MRSTGTLALPVRVGGLEAMPSGLTVSGAVVEAVSGERADGRGRVVLRFDRLPTRRRGRGHCHRAVAVRGGAEAQAPWPGRRPRHGRAWHAGRARYRRTGREHPRSTGTRITVELAQPLTDPRRLRRLTGFHPMSETFTIGRDPSCDITLADESVSRVHAEVVFLDDGRGYVRDCGIANGTRVVRERRAHRWPATPNRCST